MRQTVVAIGDGAFRLRYHRAVQLIIIPAIVKAAPMLEELTEPILSEYNSKPISDAFIQND